MPRIDQYLKIAAAAVYLGVSPNTLRKWADEGKIKTHVNPANQYRLFRQDELDRFLNRVAQTPKIAKKPK